MDIEKTLNDTKEYAELLDKYGALEKENEKLKERIRELERTDEQLAKKLKSKVSSDNEGMHVEADDLLIEFLRAIGYTQSADQYGEMSKDFWYA